MKVDIKPVEKKQGMIRKTTLHGVELTVIFSEEEKAIIKERDLASVTLLERDVPADVDPEKVANRGLVKKLAIAATSGIDALNYDLTFATLLKGPDTYFFFTPLDAKAYIAELKEDILPKAKEYLEYNAEAASADSFEL
ncbi:MAG: hypothetical protein AAFR71_02680 [Pseudomonadota bacterium]